MDVRMCIQNLSWAPATASTRQPQCWIQRAFSGCWEERCVTHWLHRWSWTGSRGLQLMFIPSGFPSDTEKRQRISRRLSRTTNHCPYVPHRERISNSSSSESKNRSNLSESEKSAKGAWALKEKTKNPLKFIFISWIFGAYFVKISSSFTRSKVKGVHADHVRGLTVHEFKHRQAPSVTGQLEEKDHHFVKMKFF